jgi:hypothetical protein
MLKICGICEIFDSHLRPRAQRLQIVFSCLIGVIVTTRWVYAIHPYKGTVFQAMKMYPKKMVETAPLARLRRFFRQ